MTQPGIVVVHSDGEDLLGSLLTHDELVEMRYELYDMAESVGASR